MPISLSFILMHSTHYKNKKLYYFEVINSLYFKTSYLGAVGLKILCFLQFFNV